MYFLTKISNIQKNNTERDIGIISANVCDIFPGTSLGSLIVIFLPTQNLYILGIVKPIINDVRRPFVPR